MKFVKQKIDMNLSNMDYVPINTLLYLIGSDCQLYIGTIVERKGYPGVLTRGECLKGDSDRFYRTAIIAWAWMD